MVYGVGEQRIAGLAHFGDDGRTKSLVSGMNRRATNAVDKNTPISWNCLK
jgi:hypothetical protein